MKFKQLCLVFTIIVTINANAQTGSEPVVILPNQVGNYFLNTWFKSERDSIELRGCKISQQDLLAAISIQKDEIKSYKRDSVGYKNNIAN